MNVRLNFIFAYFVFFVSFSALAGLRLRDGEYCFCNKSTNEIVVESLLADGKELRSCGVLVPNGHASIYDEDMFPYTLPQVFQIEYQDSDGITHTNKLETSWIKVKKAKDGTIYFVFTPERKFVLKIYLPKGDENTDMRLDGLLLPDEDNPAFKTYKKLVRAAIDGNAQKIRELLKNGAPYIWPNEPVSGTPLEWSVRWNWQDAFAVLINQLPKNYYPYDYYWSIQVAAQDGYTNILKRLLQSDLAKEVPKSSLQEIFYDACSHAKVDPAKANEIEVLKILMEHFKVGIDYKTRDFGHTLLFVAVQSDDAELVKWLLTQGANPNAKLHDGDTPLKCARSEAVKNLLIESGGK
jgi:Ankyrin repeats (3 copies)